mmetsp:Transcript_40237/g.131483  ORF Transcript_40237/g.131483 Transcript_40237/m.131483 type:complete len:90 (+) Transcript_40237:148-417(+)
MCELEWAHGVGAAARRSSAGLATPALLVRTEAASTPELLTQAWSRPSTGMLWERGPTVAAFGHRQRQRVDMLAAVCLPQTSVRQVHDEI